MERPRRRIENPRLRWFRRRFVTIFPNLSTRNTVPTSLSPWGRGVGKAFLTKSTMRGPTESMGVPRARCAATGAEISRPWNGWLIAFRKGLRLLIQGTHGVEAGG